jgi:general secretion pathway protein A
MYLEHFGLRSQPFSEHAAVRALWRDGRMEEGLARLAYLVEHGELGLMTGPSGVGKSVLLKHFLHGLNAQQCETVYCHLTQLSSSGLLKLIVAQLGEVPRMGKDRLYQQILQRAQQAEGTLLLVFDEAQLLTGDALTDLRLLISSALDVGPPLKILLSGQESLRATLKRAQHADLLNRVSVRFQLRALTKDQTSRYLDFQVSQAGGDPKLFDDSVKALIHDFTGGVPRQINNLATACLLQAAARKLARIDDDVFRQAAGEFQMI